jgi:hypothetical protein
MNKLIILAAFLCLSLSASAQQTIVEGVLKDSVGSPLEFATVMAFNKSDESTESYALTNSDGYFKLKLVEGKPYIIRYRYLGYETAEEEIVAKGSVMKLMPVLTEEAVMLDGVEVVYEFPITMNGDTISYKAEAFPMARSESLAIY